MEETSVIEQAESEEENGSVVSAENGELNDTVVSPDGSVAATKRRKKYPWEIVLKDRFLKNEKSENLYLVALLYFVVFFLSFLLVFVCFFQLCTVKGRSMESTLHDGNNVLLLKASTYKRGDIVVISKEDSANNSTNIIKRIIAVEGDEIYFKVDDWTKDNSDVFLYLKKSGESEFTLQTENYIKEPMKKDKFPSSFKYGEDNSIKIDENCYYVMGDNRNNSEDSRLTGVYETSNIYGKSVLVVEDRSLLSFFLKLLYHENNATDA